MVHLRFFSGTRSAPKKTLIWGNINKKTLVLPFLGGVTVGEEAGVAGGPGAVAGEGGGVGRRPVGRALVRAGDAVGAAALGEGGGCGGLSAQAGLVSRGPLES